MKRILIPILLLIASVSFGQVQYGGTVKAKDNAGVIGQINRTNDALKVADSALLAKVDSSEQRSVVLVGNLPATQPVSASSLPLPTGAATSANQSTEITALNTIHSDLIAPLPAGTNTIGNVGVNSINPATDVFATGTLGALNAAVTITSNGISGCIINIGTGLSGTVLLEGTTDGFVTSQSISVLNLSTGLSQSSGMIAAGYYRGINTAAWTQLRIRVSAYTSGSATGTINCSVDHNIFTVVQQQAANLNVTATAKVIGTGAASTAQLVTLANENIQDLYFTGQSAQTALVNNIIPATVSANATDLTGYRSGSVQIICPAGTYTTGAIIFEGSNDNTNFVTIPVYNQLILTGTPISAAITLVTTTNIIYTFPINFRYLRVRISTAVTGGSASVQAVSRFSQTNWTPATTNISQATNTNLQVNVGGGTLAGVTTLSNGQTAHSSASTGSPLRIAGRVAPTTIATQDATLVAGDASEVAITTAMQMVNKPNAPAELDYNFIFSTASTVVTTQPIVQASGTASIRNYIKSIRLSTDAIGSAGNVWVLDGSLTVSSIAITTGLTTTSTAHDLKVGDAIVFTTLAAGTGVSTNTIYYVTSIGSTTTFNFSATIGGSAVVPSVAYTGTTMNRILDQIRLQTTALMPTVLTYEQPLRTVANMAVNFLIPTSLTSGNIYLTINGYRGF